MIHVLVIALVVMVIAADSMPGARAAADPWHAAAWAFAPQAGLVVILWLALRLCGRGMDRTGSWVWVRAAEGAMGASRLTAVLLQAVSLFLLGWLEAARRIVGGDRIFIDEALATLPPLLVFVCGWAVHYPIDRRLREGALMHALDTTGMVPRMPTRRVYVADHVRHHLLIVLVPVSILLAWAEAVVRAAQAAAERTAWSAAAIEAAAAALHLAGVVAVIVFVPLLLRLIWRTEPLGAGPMRDRLLALCRREGVRVRDLLVWRTHSSMLNGAVLGVVPRWRYVLLTDALLEQLPADQVEAVMAHEVAHARRHHLPWLMLIVVVAVGLAWSAGSWVMGRLFPVEAEAEPSRTASLGGLALALTAGLGVFGWISRRFEEQADAFAVRHLSVGRGADGGAEGRITPEAVEAMSGALAAVAALNGIAPERFSWRHGSIASRRRRLAHLAGMHAASLPIDRLVRRIKLAALAGLALLLLAWGMGVA